MKTIRPSTDTASTSTSGRGLRVRSAPRPSVPSTVSHTAWVRSLRVAYQRPSGRSTARTAAATPAAGGSRSGLASCPSPQAQNMPSPQFQAALAA